MFGRIVLLALVTATMIVIPQPVRAATCKFVVVPSANEAPDGNDLFGVARRARMTPGRSARAISSRKSSTGMERHGLWCPAQIPRSSATS